MILTVKIIKPSNFKSSHFAAALTISMKSGFKEAPPTNAPSISG
jgi:hypothetical protein